MRRQGTLGEKGLAWEGHYLDIHKGDQFTVESCLRHRVNRLPPKELEKFLASTPSQSITPQWRERRGQLVMLGFDAPGLAQPYRSYDSYLDKMEKTLSDQSWLASDTFSLADIAVTPYVNRLDLLGWPQMWEQTRPHVADWFERIKARPAFKPALLDELLTFGRQSWPLVERLLAQAS